MNRPILLDVVGKQKSVKFYKSFVKTGLFSQNMTKQKIELIQY